MEKYEELEKLQKLKEKGILNEEEFNQEKAKILSKTADDQKTNNQEKIKRNKALFIALGGILVISIIAIIIFGIIIQQNERKDSVNNTTIGINSTKKEASKENKEKKENSNVNSTPANDTEMGLAFIKIDNTSENLTEAQKTVLQYFDDDYFDATNYEFLVRYPQIYEKMQIKTHGKVSKVIKSDNDTYQVVVWVGPSEEYYDYWYLYRSGIETSYDEYVKNNEHNFIVISGTQTAARLIEGDWITIYGRYASIDQYNIDGTSYTIPTINVYSYQHDDDNGRPDGTPDKFDLSFIRKVAKAIFNNGVIVREPTEDEAVITSSSFMNNPVFVCELDNQSNSKFGKYFFNKNYGKISDTRNDDYVFAKDEKTGINRYIEFAPDFEHFFIFVYDQNNAYLTVEYYDKDFKKIWSRDFENTVSGTYDYTENNIYLVANNYLYTINTTTGEDTFEKKYIGEKCLIRKLADGILLFGYGKTDNIMKTDLQGNILWTASVTNENGSYIVQKKDNTLITNGYNSNGELFYVVINLEDGNIMLTAEPK